MLRLSRKFAAHLRRAVYAAARPTPPNAPASAALDVWARFSRALGPNDTPEHSIRDRELAQEDLRLAVTLLGQRADAAVARVRASCDGDLSRASDAARIALALARTAAVEIEGHAVSASAND